jgi:hypothetical protein
VTGACSRLRLAGAFEMMRLMSWGFRYRDAMGRDCWLLASRTLPPQGLGARFERLRAGDAHGSLGDASDEGLLRVLAESEGPRMQARERNPRDRADLRARVRARVDTHELVLWRAPLQPVGFPWGPTEESKPPVADTPEFVHSPRWSEPRVRVGRPVDAMVSYLGVKAPLPATVVVFEIDQGVREEVARVSTTIPPGSGEHRVAWRRTPEQAQADLEHDDAAGQGGPLEYRFEVETNRVDCAGQSGPLWLVNRVEVRVDHESVEGVLPRKEPAFESIVVLSDALGKEQRALSRRGVATFAEVLVGPISMRLAQPRFTQLRWEQAIVPAGEEVRALFSFEDAIEGLAVCVEVLERDHSDAHDHIEDFELELEGVSGSAAVTFSRSPEKLEADVLNDELSGDHGPISFVFCIHAAGASSALSTQLWISHDLTFESDDFVSGAPADGTALVLVAADGTSHHATVRGGGASFRGVVYGPHVLRLGTNVP